MRVALIHDWLTGVRGGERVLEEIVGMFPQAEIFTLMHQPGSVSARIEARPIRTSPLSRLPIANGRHRYYLPLFPYAIERFDLRGFDLVLSSSHCVAKGVRVPDGVPHLCYCHTPMRYVWDQYDLYFGRGRAHPLVAAAMPVLAARLRRWDVRTAARVHAFVANSDHVRRRIERIYGRTAVVVHPPVEVDRFRPSGQREDFYLSVGALVPYKRIDIAIAAFNLLGRSLVIVGDGPEASRLRALAGPTVEFLGRRSDDEVADLCARCRAFVFPGIEDFGITAVEAQAAGAPVIAFGAGGALETVIPPGPGCTATGVFFDEANPAALAAAVRRLERLEFDPAAARANARRFAPDAFRRRLAAEIARLRDRFPRPAQDPDPGPSADPRPRCARSANVRR